MTRRAIAICLLVAVTANANAQTAYTHMSGAGRVIEATRLAPNLVQFTVQRDSYVRELNSTAIITDCGVILFDTATRPSSASLILAQLRTITARPVEIVINSHAHPDHWSGTEAFAKAFPGLTVIASEQTDRFMHLMAPVWSRRISDQVVAKREAVALEKASGKLPDGSPLPADQLAQDERDLVDLASLAQEQARLTRVYPTIVYRDRLRLTRCGTAIELTAMTGDQDGTTVAYLPHDKVLLTGDLVSYPMPYLNTRPSRQLESLRAIDGMDFALLVPGHGPAMRDHRFLKLEIALIEAAIAGVQHELAAGDADLATVQSRVTLDKLRHDFTGGDADLDTRFTTRVKDLVKFTFQEMTGTG